MAQNQKRSQSRLRYVLVAGPQLDCEYCIRRIVLVHHTHTVCFLQPSTRVVSLHHGTSTVDSVSRCQGCVSNTESAHRDKPQNIGRVPVRGPRAVMSSMRELHNCFCHKQSTQPVLAAACMHTGSQSLAVQQPKWHYLIIQTRHCLADRQQTSLQHHS
jgi:hypothetical protein